MADREEEKLVTVTETYSWEIGATDAGQPAEVIRIVRQRKLRSTEVPTVYDLQFLFDSESPMKPTPELPTTDLAQQSTLHQPTSQKTNIPIGQQEYSVAKLVSVEGKGGLPQESG